MCNEVTYGSASKSHPNANKVLLEEAWSSEKKKKKKKVQLRPHRDKPDKNNRTHLTNHYWARSPYARQGEIGLRTFFFFGLSRAAPAAYGSSQARGWIRATAASLQPQLMPMQDPNYICDLRHSSCQRRIPNSLSEARDQTRVLMDTSWVHYRWATMGTPEPSFKGLTVRWVGRQGLRWPRGEWSSTAEPAGVQSGASTRWQGGTHLQEGQGRERQAAALRRASCSSEKELLTDLSWEGPRRLRAAGETQWRRVLSQVPRSTRWWERTPPPKDIWAPNECGVTCMGRRSAEELRDVGVHGVPGGQSAENRKRDKAIVNS